MITIGVYDAKVRLSQLLQQVQAGEEVVITHGRKPVARLVPIRQSGEGTFLMRKVQAPSEELKKIGRKRLKVMSETNPNILPYDLAELIDEARGG